jgi:Holliday junction resolvase RusA-like endonuclease
VLRLTIDGAPRTKKTHNRIVVVKSKGRATRRIVLPSEAWESWAEHSNLLIAQQIRRAPITCPLPDRPYNCAAIFYRDAARGDAVGYYQGLADLLEKAKVVTNDKHIVQWDGSRLLIDRDNPRVELTLTEVEAA